MARSKASFAEAMQKVAKPEPATAEHAGKGSGKRKLSLYLDPPLYRSLRLWAAERETTVNAILTEAVIEALQRGGR
jgi:hypothetical protein